MEYRISGIYRKFQALLRLNRMQLRRWFRLCPMWGILCLYVSGLAGPVLELKLPVILLFLIAGCIFAAVWRGRRWPLWSAVIILGIVLGHLHIKAPWQTYGKYLRRQDGSAGKIRCIAADEPATAGIGIRCRLSIKEIYAGNQWRHCRGNVLGYFSRNDNIEYGDNLELEGAFVSFSENKSYEIHNRIKGIRRTFHASTITARKNASGWRRYWKKIRSLREKLGEMLVTGIKDEKAAGMYQAMILGMREKLAPEINRSFVKSATIHIFSISGLHVSLMSLFMQGFLGYVGVSIRTRRFLVCPFLGLYVILSGAAPPALRAYFMIFPLVISQWRLRSGSAENALALSAVVLLIMNPLYLRHTGFLFSFTLVAVIIRGAKLCCASAGLLLEKRKWIPPGYRKQKLEKLLRQLSGAVGGCLTAWLGCTGLMMYMNRMVSFGSILVNFFIGPTGLCLVGSAIPKIVCAWLCPALAELWGTVLEKLLTLLLVLSEIGSAPGMYVTGRQPAAGIVFLYYALLACFLCKVKPWGIRLSALLFLPVIIWIFAASGNNSSFLLACSGSAGGPAAAAYVHGKTAVILQPGSQSAARNLLEELQLLGADVSPALFIPGTSSMPGATFLRKNTAFSNAVIFDDVLATSKGKNIGDIFQAEGILHRETSPFLTVHGELAVKTKENSVLCSLPGNRASKINSSTGITEISVDGDKVYRLYPALRKQVLLISFPK